MRLSAPRTEPADATLSVRDARRMFTRTLTAWASDVLWLRRHRLDRPSLRPGRGHLVCDWWDEPAPAPDGGRRAG